MQEGLAITTDKEKIMDDSKVDEVVSGVNDMKSFQLVVKEVRECYTTMIIDAVDEESAKEGYWEVVHPELNTADWECVDMNMNFEHVYDLDEYELDEDETDLPRFTYDHKAG